MLLEALVACAGVTLKAVATAIDFRAARRLGQRRGRSRFPRASLGVDRAAPVGFRDIRLAISRSTPMSPEEKRQNLLRLTERYCVVLQDGVRNAPPTAADLDVKG